ncbi:hypothetical protein [Mitsuaria sp. GD03876]|uniref:hypothetical protein n=1 Tax=Mitsuaria sp. GD03876 TaxID=2975399 RepID=UPI00244AF1FC|nr:hypothetical protein [Mitsuaria sp. GD03876]MDH0867822.1 hypothetical protein [Mitsuaria sp. GD03876]
MAPEMMAFWLAGICPPAAGWILNLTMRGSMAFKTSVADCAIAPALILISTTLWMVIVRWLEPIVARERPGARELFRKAFCIALMWTLMLMNIFGHYFLFIRGFHAG